MGGGHDARGQQDQPVGRDAELPPGRVLVPRCEESTVDPEPDHGDVVFGDAPVPRNAALEVLGFGNDQGRPPQVITCDALPDFEPPALAQVVRSVVHWVRDEVFDRDAEPVLAATERREIAGE